MNLTVLFTLQIKKRQTLLCHVNTLKAYCDQIFNCKSEEAVLSCASYSPWSHWLTPVYLFFQFRPCTQSEDGVAIPSPSVLEGWLRNSNAVCIHLNISPIFPSLKKLTSWALLGLMVHCSRIGLAVPLLLNLTGKNKTRKKPVN